MREIWNFIQEPTFIGSQWVLLVLLTVGGIIAAAPLSWSKTNLIATWVHEIGHALAALLLGRGVKRIVIHKDGSGYTEHTGENKKIRLFLITLIGYPFPSIVGWGLVASIASGKNHIALVVLLVVSGLVLLLQRSLISLSLTISILIFLLILTQAPASAVTYILTAVAGYLLIASPKTIIALHETRKMNNKLKQETHSDAKDLAKLTKIPTIIWEIMFMSISLLLLYLSVRSILAV